MLTPSELRNAQFSKARLGGYVMSEVDKLLDEVTPDYEALYKEQMKGLEQKRAEAEAAMREMEAELKQKMLEIPRV